MMQSQATERPIIVASLSGPTLKSLTIDNLIWPSVLDYLGIKEDVMEIPGKIRVSKNNQCQNLIGCFITCAFLILVIVMIWYANLISELFRIIISFACVLVVFFTFILWQCSENQEDIKDKVIAEFNEKCKFYQVSNCFFSLQGGA